MLCVSACHTGLTSSIVGVHAGDRGREDEKEDCDQGVEAESRDSAHQPRCHRGQVESERYAKDIILASPVSPASPLGTVRSSVTLPLRSARRRQVRSHVGLEECVCAHLPLRAGEFVVDLQDDQEAQVNRYLRRLVPEQQGASANFVLCV